MENKKEGMKVKCKRCGYEWKTHGTLYYVPCPRCHTLNKIRELPPRQPARTTRAEATT